MSYNYRGIPQYLLASVVFASLHVSCEDVRAEDFAFEASFTSFGEPASARFQLWLPDGVPRVRGLVVMLSGICGDWRNQAVWPYQQQAAASLGFGIVGVEAFGSENNPNCLWGDPDSDEAADILQRTLEAAAAVSGHQELQNAPVGLIGFSMGAVNNVILAASAPSRIISHSSGGLGGPPFDMSEATRRVPGVFILGSFDPNAGYTYEGFANYRQQDAQVAYVVNWGGAHSMDHRSDPLNEGKRFVGEPWEMAWYWLAEAVRLRYPIDQYPSTVPGEPLVLNELDTSKGWLGEAAVFSRPNTPVESSPFPEIGDTADYSGDATTASWLPSEAAANVYRAMTSIAPNRPWPNIPGQFLPGPLEFTSPKYIRTTSVSFPEFFVGNVIPILVEPHEFDDVNSITEMRFYDGDELIGVDSAGPDWGVPYTPTYPGIHGLVVVATDDLGNQTSSFRTVVVQRVPEPSPIALATLGVLGVVGYGWLYRDGTGRGAIPVVGHQMDGGGRGCESAEAAAT